MPIGLGPRFLIEAALLIALAVVAGVERFSTITIVVMMAAAWAALAAIEVAAWLVTRAGRATTSTEAADTAEQVPEPVPAPDVEPVSVPEPQADPAGEPEPAPEPGLQPEPVPSTPRVDALAEASAAEWERSPAAGAAPQPELSEEREPAPAAVPEIELAPEPEPQAKREPEPDVAPDPAREHDAQLEPAPEPEAEAEHQPDPEQPEPEPAPEPKPEAAHEPEPERREPEPEPEAPPEPQPQVVALDTRRADGPREWNLWELERLARERSGDDVARDEERSYVLMYLREFAGPDGNLSVDFDGVVRESFGDMLGSVRS